MLCNLHIQVISKCRDEELEHRDVGLDQNAKLVCSYTPLLIITLLIIILCQAPGYEAMSEVIKAGCRAAIWMSERF